MPSPRLSAPDTRTLLIGLGYLRSCCWIQFLKQRKVTRSMSLVLCVLRSLFTQTNCEESMAADWEYIDPIYNRFLVSQFSVEAVSGEICRGKNGVDGLLDFLEWFTKYRALDKCLYHGKLALLLEAMRKISPKAFDLSLSRGQSLNPSWPLSPVEQLAPNNSPCSLPFLNNGPCPLPFLNNGPCPLPILNNGLHPLPFFNNSPHLPLSNSNLHSFPTNGLCSLPDNSLCHFPYSWKPSLIMWMLLDQMMRGFLPQHKHALTNGSVLMGLRNSPCLHLELMWNLQTLVKCMITAILMKRR